MEESKKKPIMIGVVVACLALALLITFGLPGGGGGGIEDISPEDKIWVKCNNPDCKAEYEMGKKAYFKYIQDNIDPMAMVAPPVVCESCSKDSVFRAEKCQNQDCGVVFFRGSVPNDFADRCPECERSETEESRKRRAAGGVG
jgi:hypothetical protein